MKAKQDEQKIKRDENLKHLPLAAKLALKTAEMDDDELSSNKLQKEMNESLINLPQYESLVKELKTLLSIQGNGYIRKHKRNTKKR